MVKKMEKGEFKHIIRVANTDLDGSKPIGHSLRKVKGVNFMFANMVCSLLGIDRRKKAGELLDAEISKIEEMVKNPSRFDVPSWMMNRRQDIEEGDDKHLVSTDLRFVKEFDIKRMKKIKSYKGTRHATGLPVRGQRTKSNFRRNKGKTSVVTKKKGKSGRV